MTRIIVLLVRRWSSPPWRRSICHFRIWHFPQARFGKRVCCQWSRLTQQSWDPALVRKLERSCNGISVFLSLIISPGVLCYVADAPQSCIPMLLGRDQDYSPLRRWIWIRYRWYLLLCFYSRDISWVKRHWPTLISTVHIPLDPRKKKKLTIIATPIITLPPVKQVLLPNLSISHISTMVMPILAVISTAPAIKANLYSKPRALSSVGR